jgi:D-alanine-D-alanine ligase
MKKNIGVFFGGRSVEHEISIISALQVIKSIDKDKFDVTPVYISKDGIWYTGSWLMYIDNFKNFKELIKNCKKVIPSMNAGEGTLMSYPDGLLKSSKVVATIDIAFPVFHGTYGEDGCFQGVFEIMNIPYVGANVAGSAICMNKSLTKEICKAIEIPIIDFFPLDADDWYKDKAKHMDAITAKFGFPMIVKPNDLGSSVGISKATNKSELENGIELAAAYSNNILIESFVSAIQEVNCSVADTPGGVVASVCEEPVVASGDLLSFDEKYLSSGASSEGMAGTKRKIPADISDSQKNEIQGYAKHIFKHLGCSGVVRIDFIIDRSSGRTYLNEINTIPGSLAFYLWEATDKKFTLLTTEIIEAAVKRFAKNNKLKKSFKSNVLFSIDGSKLSGKLG